MALLGIVSSLIFADEKRKLVQVFPDPVRNLWNKWELRGMVLVSLALQISLIYSGNRRKYIVSKLMRIFIWSAYLMADWIAIVSLGLLVDRQGNSSSCSVGNNTYGDNKLTAFWAPFLLLHLGGPDTITAYALADNELWIRHLLGLVVQTIGAVYITLLSWEGTLLSYLSMPMLVCGIIKYGERSWVLRSANREQFRDSVLTARDPGPSYAKFMEEFSLKEAEGYHVTADQVVEVHVPGDDLEAFKSSSIPDANILLRADSFFETLKFKRLFVDLILGFHPRDESQSYFQKQKSETAFEVIEVELGFAYDVFYTKAPIIYTPLGLFFRFITFSFTLSVFIIFMIFIALRSQKHQLVDLVITCILLLGAILLEAYAATSLLSSDWTNLWLSKHSKTPLFIRSIYCLQSRQKGKRWSNSMSQYNLLDFCLSQKPLTFRVPCRKELEKLLGKPREKLEDIRQLKNQPQISLELKDFIFQHFLKKSTDSETDLKSLCTCRGGLSLQNHKNYGKFRWTIDVEFDHSILIWHIATDLCYNLEAGQRKENMNSGSNVSKQEWDDAMSFSKQLADYMLYILVVCPFMLPIGIGMIRFRDTCAEALEFFRDRSNIANKFEACEILGQVSTKVFPAKVKGDRSKSVLFEACKLADSLQDMDDAKKWKIVVDVWVEILGYAASQCRGFYHAQQLERGGELLTHVWLLMAHFGITEHFQISEGHGRAKLAVK